MWDKEKAEPLRAVTNLLPGGGMESGSKTDEKKIGSQTLDGKHMIEEMGKVIQSSTSNLVSIMKDVLGNEKDANLAESTHRTFDTINK